MEWTILSYGALFFLGVLATLFCFAIRSVRSEDNFQTRLANFLVYALLISYLLSPLFMNSYLQKFHGAPT